MAEKSARRHVADGRSARVSRGQFLLPSRWQGLTACFLLAMVPIAICFMILLAWGINKEFSHIAETARLRYQADRILLNMIEMSATEQAFTATQDYEQYRRFFQASQSLDHVFYSLEALAQNRPHWLDWLKHIRKGADEHRRKLTQRIMGFHEPGKKPQQDTAPKKEQSRVSSNQLAQLIAKFIHEEEKNLAHRQENLNILRAVLVLAAMITIIGILIMAFIIIYLFRRDTHRQRVYQSMRNSENAILEQRVKNRTAELETAHAHAEKERRRAELLLQDTSHRIGNFLATVSSLLGLQLQRSENPEVRDALASARDRIQTIAAAHRRLRLGEDMETASVGEFLSAVVNDVQMGIAPLQRERIKFRTHFEVWHLASRDVTTLGIILGELLTNAVKHAFPDGRQGRIDISFGKLNSKQLQLVVEDNGTGLSDKNDKANNAQGLGKIVILQLCMQFGSRPRFENGRHGGTRVIIPLPTPCQQKDKNRKKHPTGETGKN